MSTFKDIKGQVFGKVVALESTTRRNSSGSVMWRCMCDCGSICEIGSHHLVSGTTQSCGCLHIEALRTNGRKLLKDITNQRFGRLVVLASTKERIGRSSVWLCLCDCGNICTMISGNLKSGRSQSCGCLLCKGSAYLYVFRSNKTALIKIGISGNVIRRKKELENDLRDSFDLLYYRLSSKTEETQIHKKLEQYRAIHPAQPKGIEWFYPTEEVMRLIQNDIITVAI